MLRFLHKNQIPLLLFGISLLAISYVQMLHTEKSSSNNIPVTTLDTKEYEKLRQQLTLITERHNPREAFSLLRKRMKENTSVIASCHGLAHELGHASYMKYQDFGKAISETESICNAGYMHGVIESYFADTSDIQTKARTLCDQYSSGTYVRSQCDHGIGHGFMFATDNKLPESLVLCNTLEREDARERCINGVFMENVMADQTVHISSYAKTDDPLYPCPQQQNKYKSHCYGYVPTSYLKLHPNDYEKVIPYCEKVEMNYIPSCIEGVGRKVIIDQIDRPNEVVKLCMSSKKFSDYCITGMIHEFINHHASVTEARALCPQLPSEKQAICSDIVRQKSLLFQ